MLRSSQLTVPAASRIRAVVFRGGCPAEEIISPAFSGSAASFFIHPIIHKIKPEPPATPSRSRIILTDNVDYAILYKLKRFGEDIFKTGILRKDPRMDTLTALSLEFFTDTKIVIPITQIILFLSISTLALLFGRAKLALMTNYLFALYWGYLCNLELYTDLFQEAEYMVYVYFGFGIAVAVMALVGFMWHPSNR